MIDATLFRRKHQLWLRITFMSFAVNDPWVKNRLYEFSQMEFRHLKWLAGSLYENNSAYDYERDPNFTIESTSFFELIRTAINEIKTLHLLYLSSPLSERMKNDEKYILSALEVYLEKNSLDEPITAFNRSRHWPDSLLSSAETDALTYFLFEESYKEYELIMVYFYQQIRATTAAQVSHYQDLIDESHFHLRSFGEMMAKMGILALPRPLHPRTYEITDMEKFLTSGIQEEENAKEECRKLSSSITDEKLASFFEFINYQESYHIEIMKKLLGELNG
ncbi:iron-binding protein [Sulfuricurvum sp.]|uniref:iron-binding protein n=1 Tax=Sulfuricurvum sp. TaxID=2025608 RepID=UPI00262C3019|nr:iron-binding protein [Sulfuricurvum sp.]MDD2267392.1 iron-binding protein [Sulfuricurvum sp.]MDD2783072.1 iron-binding protein [Sulfuricurvum sp.]